MTIGSTVSPNFGHSPVHPDDDFEYIVVTLTPEEERFVQKAVDAIYYTALTVITVLGLVWLAQRPPRK